MEVYRSINFPVLYAACKKFGSSIDNFNLDELFLRQLFLLDENMFSKLVNSNGNISCAAKYKALFRVMKTTQNFAEIAKFFEFIFSDCSDYNPAVSLPIQSSERPEMDQSDDLHQCEHRLNHNSKRKRKQQHAEKRFVSFHPEKSFELNKIQKQSITKLLLQVERKYPHYEQCSGCSLCDSTFRSSDLTWCSSKHGGQPCNDLGLYPHASETFLTIVHSTKKFVHMPTGYPNPLRTHDLPDLPVKISPTSSKSSDEVSSARKETTKRNNLTPSRATSSGVNRVDSTLANYKAVPHYYNEAVEKEMRRVKNAQNWRLHVHSPLSHYHDALKYFTSLKKYVPTYVVPSWATGASKNLYQCENVELARRVSQQIHERKRLKRFNSKRRRNF